MAKRGHLFVLWFINYFSFYDSRFVVSYFVGGLINGNTNITLIRAKTASSNTIHNK